MTASSLHHSDGRIVLGLTCQDFFQTKIIHMKSLIASVNIMQTDPHRSPHTHTHRHTSSQPSPLKWRWCVNLGQTVTDVQCWWALALPNPWGARLRRGLTAGLDKTHHERQHLGLNGSRNIWAIQGHSGCWYCCFLLLCENDCNTMGKDTMKDHPH